MAIAEPQETAAGREPARLELLHIRQTTRYERLVKPVLDRLLAAVLLIILSPVLLATAALVRWHLGSPILFLQPRVGLHGNHFSMLKFRTMEKCKRTGSQAYVGPERRVRHKSPEDPRLGRLGRVLRAASLDELPQLVNVLRGEMSIVGPRPELVEIVEQKYEPWQHARHTVKPGVTGLWQVTERANRDVLMYEVTDIDLRYARHVSWRTDLSILVKTLPAMLGGRGF